MNGLRLLVIGQKGSGAVELLLVTAFILVPAAMLLLGLPALLEYRSLGDAAAREAARACAVAPDPAAGQQRAQETARRMLGERGLDPQQVETSIDCSQEWAPGSEVSARISYIVPALRILGIGDVGSVRVSRSYREKIQPYRSQ